MSGTRTRLKRSWFMCVFCGVFTPFIRPAYLLASHIGHFSTWARPAAARNLSPIDSRQSAYLPSCQAARAAFGKVAQTLLLLLLLLLPPLLLNNCCQLPVDVVVVVVVVVVPLLIIAQYKCWCINKCNYICVCVWVCGAVCARRTRVAASASVSATASAVCA